MQKIFFGKIRAAIDKYNMINENDKIAIGISGGKDSIALLYALYQIKKYYPKKFDILAITIDPEFKNKKNYYNEICKLCEKLEIDYIIKHIQLYKIIFEERKEKNPCSLCARLRRGILHNIAKENNCNKIALGHHMDDAIETFFMNIFNNGQISCFSPISYLSRKDLYMIRPLVFCEEKEITSFVNKLKLPIVKSECPADGVTEREKTKNLISSLECNYKDLKTKVIGAMTRANLNNWGDKDE